MPLATPIFTSGHDQHTTGLDGDDIQRVCITATHHPFCGHTFPIRQRRIKRGQLHFIIELPSGATQLIPAHWAAPCSATASLAPGPLLTSTCLRTLSSIVASLCVFQPQEAAYDHSSATRALGQLHSPDPTPPDCAVDPVAAPLDTSPAPRSDRRSP
jgi:hypothetical protein